MTAHNIFAQGSALFNYCGLDHRMSQEEIPIEVVHKAVDGGRIGCNNTRADQGYRVVRVLQELHKMKTAGPQREYA